MLFTLIFFLIFVFVCLAYATLKRNYEYYEAMPDTYMPSKTGPTGYIIKCDPPLTRIYKAGTDSSSEKYMCVNSNNCPSNAVFDSSTGTCLMSGKLISKKSQECTCPHGYKYNINSSSNICTQLQCSDGWELDKDNVCMLKNPMSPLNSVRALSNVNLLEHKGSKDFVRSVCGASLASEGYSYLEGGWCVKCPPDTWGSNTDNGVKCVNDTGIHAIWTSNTIQANCVIKEPFTNSADNWTWNRYDGNIFIGCPDDTIYDKAYKQCLDKSVTCSNGSVRSGKLGCGVLLSNVEGTKCSCPSGYGIEFPTDTKCKKFKCNDKYILKNQDCIQYEIPTETLFTTNPECPRSNITNDGKKKTYSKVQGTRGIDSNGKLTTGNTCVICPYGTSSSRGIVDDTGTTLINCVTAYKIPPSYDGSNTKEAICK